MKNCRRFAPLAAVLLAGGFALAEQPPLGGGDIGFVQPVDLEIGPLVIVPEPSAGMALFGGVGMLMILSRWRARRRATV